MASSSMITFAAALCLVAASAVAVPPATLQETCQSAGEQEALCVQLLSSTPAATETAAHLQRLFDSEDLKNMSPELQRCVEDCTERYQSAAKFLGQASEKMTAGSFDEAGVLIDGAQSVVSLCQRSCQGVPQGELTACTKGVDQLCTIAASVTRLVVQK
ncbi:unnamed protein product [Triticum turgidum subsp. durum]|uniref:Pectinesterase inhibitor domain-containing protein n=1 Tax=Triticum turgidum subsp. durum TaxID=4567 RepID=A0A9R0QVG3_TRITD|nr:unnamed protein product [Triticum turgidum subsp. durum]